MNVTECRGQLLKSPHYFVSVCMLTPFPLAPLTVLWTDITEFPRGLLVLMDFLLYQELVVVVVTNKGSEPEENGTAHPCGCFQARGISVGGGRS